MSNVRICDICRIRIKDNDDFYHLYLWTPQWKNSSSLEHAKSMDICMDCYEKLSLYAKKLYDDSKEYCDCKCPGCSYEDIFVKTKARGEQILNKLEDVMDMYGKVTVPNLFDLPEVKREYPETDAYYGWDSLEGARILEMGDGTYRLDMPAPKLLIEYTGEEKED